MWRKRTYEARPVSTTLSLCHSANWTLGHCVSVTLSLGQLVTRSLCFKAVQKLMGEKLTAINGWPLMDFFIVQNGINGFLIQKIKGHCRYFRERCFVE